MLQGPLKEENESLRIMFIIGPCKESNQSLRDVIAGANERIGMCHYS